MKGEIQDIKGFKLKLEQQLTKPLDDISVVNLVDLFIGYAYSAGASDIHIEPAAGKVVVRFRIDGILHNIFDKVNISSSLQQEIISRIKVLSGLRTDEHNAPQDGRFKAALEELGGIDVRVSIIPTYYGENAVMRILAENTAFSLETIGFSPEDYKRVVRAIKKPYGMIVASGPTGSGKTSMLYTILKQLNVPGVSILTIEDPIEYSVESITQVQVANDVGLSFASGLRSILRQDPNIIMVGEIRDEETAGIAVNAALTGHILLSTIHTNDAATTFPRMIDMGVPPFLVASTINIAIGQRLVRTVCKNCKKKKVLSEEELASVTEFFPELIKKGQDTFSYGAGCDVCSGTGYQGRIAIHEVLPMSESVRALILRRADAQQIKTAAMKEGMTTMVQDGLAKAKAGLTTLEEILRVINE